MKTINTTLSVLMMLVSTITYAQQAAPLTMSLAEAQAYAAINSYSLHYSEMDVDAAIYRNKELTAIGLPQINGEVVFQNNLVLPTTVIPANAFNPMAPEDELIGLQFGTDYNANAVLSASQLIFDGSYIFGLKAAKKYVQLNEYGKQQTLNDIRKEIADAYGMAVLARESLVLLEEDYVTLQELVEETRKTYEAGFREELDVDQLNLQLSNLENMKRKSANDVNVSLNLLKFQMGMPVQDPLILSETIESLVGISYMPEMIDTEPQLATHTDILTFQTNVDLRALNVKVEKMANYPNLSGFFTTQQQAFRNDMSFFGSGSEWYQGTYWGASLKVPIFSGFSRHNKIQQAKVEVERAVMQKDQTEQRIILQIATEKANYANAMDIYNTEKESLELARKINDRTQIKFQEGISGSFELKEIQAQLLTTQRNYILAAYDVVTTKAALQKALDIK